MLVVFIAGWFLGLYKVLDRKLKEIDHTQLMFNEAILGLIGFSLYILIEGVGFNNGEFRVYSAQEYGIIMGACLLDTVGFEFMSAALSYDSTKFVTLFTFNLVYYGLITDIFIILEPINALHLAGGLVVHVATIVVAAYKLCKNYRDANVAVKAEEKVTVNDNAICPEDKKANDED